MLLLAVGFLAFANGANDNFKGVASLFGSRTLSYRRALSLATATTAAGSLCAPFLAFLLLTIFPEEVSSPTTSSSRAISCLQLPSAPEEP